MPDVVIIGGGVIGLSAAFELAGRGRRVTVLEAQQPGREASWAGAGILPPGRAGDPNHPLAALCRETCKLWTDLSAELRELTGVDNGFRRCGGICVTSDQWTEAAIAAEIGDWQLANVRVERMTSSELAKLESSLAPAAAAYQLPEQCQVRNPRHLQALVLGCGRRGVDIHAGQPVFDFENSAERVTAVRTATDRFEAESFLVTAGAWTQGLLAAVRRPVPIVPVRGQIVLLSHCPSLFSHVIESGPRYLVPRGDGRVLVGSTEEWVGFDKRNTAAAIQELLAFAESLVPSLSDAHFETAWSGLRPHAVDGMPYLGRVPELPNLFVAAGHFRSGLHLSPITARLMGQLMSGESPELPLNAFAIDR